MKSLQYHFFRVIMKLSKATYDWGAPIEKQRALVEKNAGFIKAPEELTVDRTAVGGVAGEWLRMPGADEDRVLLHFHGGGYSMCSCITHRGMVARLAGACGVRAFLPEYRLAPENPFPAPVEDALAAYRGLLQEGISPQDIIISGDSAGGGLAAVTLISLRDGGEPLPSLAILFSPWTDLALTGESLTIRAKADPWLVRRATEIQAARYCGDNDPRNPLISPLYADLRGLPPILIQVGEDEILLSDSTRLAARAREAGVDVSLDIWPGMWHVWQCLAPKMPEASRAIEAAGRYVQSAMVTQAGRSNTIAQ